LGCYFMQDTRSRHNGDCARHGSATSAEERPVSECRSNTNTCQKHAPHTCSARSLRSDVYRVATADGDTGWVAFPYLRLADSAAMINRNRADE
jgi:hypothetical protein